VLANSGYEVSVATADVSSRDHVQTLVETATDIGGTRDSSTLAGYRLAKLRQRLSYRGSVDTLGQGHDDPLRSAHIHHAPDVLVLTDAADQPVAVRG